MLCVSMNIHEQVFQSRLVTLSPEAATDDYYDTIFLLLLDMRYFSRSSQFNISTYYICYDPIF
jgi:hypothetical protein